MSFLDEFIDDSHAISCPHLCMRALGLCGGEYGVRAATCMNSERDHQGEHIEGVQSLKTLLIGY